MTRVPVDRRVAPPSGHPAPTEASLGRDAKVSLLPIAQEICRRYRAEFPDEDERYGDAGTAWCVHDNQHLLNWGAGAVRGLIDMNPEVAWLATVLHARGFPVDRLARDLDIGAEVVLDHVDGEEGRQLSAVLAAAAAFVRTEQPHLPGRSAPDQDGSSRA